MVRKKTGMRTTKVAASPTATETRGVARRSSRGRILVIATREDVTMLQEVTRLLGGKRAESS